MASASHSAGVFGRWGQASFKPLDAVNPAPTPTPTPTASDMRTPRKKFFKSRNNAASTGSCSVAVRLRPNDADEDSVVMVEGSGSDVYLPGADKTYRFDHVFGGGSLQSEVYDAAVWGTLDKFVGCGANAAIIAYGQTGAGKTHTMGTACTAQQVDESTAGIIPRVLRDVFRGVGDSTVKISFFEILNERIYDLLRSHKVPLTLKEVGNRFHVTDLKCAAVADEAEALELLEKGRRTRSTGATAQNAHSSRSHAVFVVSLEKVDPETGERVENKMSLVDLAGSESSAASAECGPERLKEGVNINKGLSALNRCFVSICNGDRHVPFRESTLTKVLRDCLMDDGGQTTMIACVSSTSADLRATVDTLRYADCVKKLEKPPMPPHLAVATPFRRQLLIPPTPATSRKRMNNTIETPTPSKRRALPTAPMNRSASASLLTSTVAKLPSLETIRDDCSSDFSSQLCDSMSDVSSIGGFSNILNEAGGSSSAAAHNMSLVDARSILSPMMRSLKEDLKKHIQDTLKGHLEETMVASKKEKVSRATSSPVRKSPRLNKSPTEPIAAENKEEEDADMAEETIISGTHLSAVRKKMRETAAAGGRPVLGDLTNKARHKKRVEATASPVLNKRKSSGDEFVAPDKENPATPNSKSVAAGGCDTPPLSVMEKTLGLNPDSPLLFGCDDDGDGGSTRPASVRAKRSVRRTTMVHSELSKSLFGVKADEQEAVLRRSKRLSVLQATMPPPPPRVHPLQTKTAWTVYDQGEHNANILTLLNSGNHTMLEKLPGIGPKTAVKIHTQRHFANGFKSIEDLKNIRGLPKKFFERFCVNNQVVL